jgi:hypothetical protein
MKPYSLMLYDRVVADNAALDDVTDLLRPTWRRSIRRVGGYWLGTAELRMERGDLDDFFMDGLLREIRETTLGEETWRGAIVMMEYTRGGYTFVRDATRMSNAMRLTYTRIGDNLLSNGSGETGAWTAYNGATVAQDATWKTHGAYSIKVTVADTTVRGATIEPTIAVVADETYLIRGTLKVTSGSWRVSVNRTDTGASLAFFSTKGKTGDFTFNLTIENTNTYTGNVNFRITSEASAGVVNVDACVFQTAPCPADTGWYTNDEAIEMFGRKENILKKSSMSTADANGEAESALLQNGWPMLLPPRAGRTLNERVNEDVIKLTVAGYWSMLNWVYTTLAGTDAKSDWVTALAALQPTYVAAVFADVNTTDFVIDDRDAQRVGDVLKALVEGGEPGGAKYAIGVGAGRTLNYDKVAEELSYILRGDRLCSVSGDEIEPALVKPGWMLWETLPSGPGWLSANVSHDPRWVYLEEVELQPPTEKAPEGSIAFKLD